jgi:glutaminase
MYDYNGECNHTSIRHYNGECSYKLGITIDHYSDEWIYEVGIPVKSGVSGLIYTVIPCICGIATYSPKLDKIG